MRFLTLAAFALAFPAAGRADPRPIPTVPYGEAKPAGYQAVAPKPGPVTPAPATVIPAPAQLPPTGVVGVPVPVPPYASVLPPVVPPAHPFVVLPDGGMRMAPSPVPDGTIRFGPGTTPAERFQYWQLVHSWAPDGTPKPLGAGNFYTEMKWIFGSNRQWFGTAGATVGYGRGTREP